MTSVHDVPKRRTDVGDRYRMTRIAFDVISAFGCLQASGLPGPAIVNVLGEHGYSTSSVHNQLVRMVQRGIISSERFGRVSVYRLSEHVLSDFGDIAGDHVFPDYEGRFHTIVYSVPEAERGLRDRLQYIARSLGYRQLRPGILIGFADRSSQLMARLPEMPGPSWSEAGELSPDSIAAARRMTTRAFELDAALDQLPPLEQRMSALSSGGSAPGTGCPELSLGAFFDLYFDVARAVMTHPLLPEILVDGNQPALRFRALMQKCNLEYYLRYDQQIRECAAASSSFDLIEWLPEH
ncbi:PaaX family transcriptional regulator [Brevibacterium linens]|uniref:PaaX family transcriptional regulator n=1 Tax=Brevibacterium linens TaxID=1703 RepID=A0A0B9A5V7_BRELN|nr:PaaX family transcriptional regulator [Brevibacterium linens]AMT93394.1 PaaX family transcriptional regulator [Brevibacterium linens]KHS54240.1 transcriptional regulator, PaaX family [Brevibacterium linens]